MPLIALDYCSVIRWDDRANHFNLSRTTSTAIFSTNESVLSFPHRFIGAPLASLGQGKAFTLLLFLEILLVRGAMLAVLLLVDGTLRLVVDDSQRTFIPTATEWMTACPEKGKLPHIVANFSTLDG